VDQVRARIDKSQPLGQTAVPMVARETPIHSAGGWRFAGPCLTIRQISRAPLQRMDDMIELGENMTPYAGVFLRSLRDRPQEQFSFSR